MGEVHLWGLYLIWYNAIYVMEVLIELLVYVEEFIGAGIGVQYDPLFLFSNR